jgi:serine phosphatase RsbU (regulator of sigma subunit)
MTQPLIDLANKRRRTQLYRYTFLAMLSYQIPLGIAYLGRFFGVAKYEYADINYGYLAYILCSLTALSMIRMRKTISKGFIVFILHFQVWISILVSAYLVYAMKDLRHMVPIGCILVLFFVFIQSTFPVSVMVTLFTMVIYLVATFIGIRVSGHPGVFTSEALYILVFVPVCLFIAYMAKVLQEQQRKIKVASSRLKSAHNELAITHEHLESTHRELSEQNQRMIDSIQYAEVIQRSLLPGIERIKTVSPDSMFIWIPKDIVGGDIFYTFSEYPLSIIALADCTGHGVPGAFLTIIVYSDLRRIIKEEGCRAPSDILQRLNAGVKNALHKNNRESDADDGLDAGVCLIDHVRKRVYFAGGRIPLFYILEDDVLVVQGDKHSLGYRDSDTSFEFKEHAIDVPGHGSFYLKTDGFTDQLGGPNNLRFGTGRFKKTILAHHGKPFAEQRKLFLDVLGEYQGDHEQKDDVTVIGFHI